MEEKVTCSPFKLSDDIVMNNQHDKTKASSEEPISASPPASIAKPATK